MTSALPPADDAQLEERLSRPSPSLPAILASVPGDIIVLGAGGKMGPSLSRMAARAGGGRRVIAVSRWADAAAAESLAADGVEVVTADLLDASQLASLPDAPNVVFMAGQKFGTTGNPAMTWAMNAGVPALVVERYATARKVVFSTGNVYALTNVQSGGATEGDEPAPIGEYAYSCLARERLFAAGCARHRGPTCIVRLNYAHDLRYGVLTDLASRIARRQPIDLRMGHVNVIWQGDANAAALASLAAATTPQPYTLNVAGGETLRVRDLANLLGDRLGIQPVFSGGEEPDALLSNSSRLRSVFPDDLLPVATLLDWVAAWLRRGGRLLDKPTSFERRDGRF